LRTDFLTRLFPGSKRLLEIADELSEIKTMCECGKKATVTARIDGTGKIVTAGRQVVLGGNDRYIAMCHKCFVTKVKKQENE
jgi:thymidine kinase